MSSPARPNIAILGDAEHAAAVKALGIRPFVTDSIMTDDASRARLAVGPVEASGRGTMFYVHAPEGILVEVNAPGR